MGLVICRKSFAAFSFDHSNLDRLQQFGDDVHLETSGIGDPEGGGHIDAHRMARWRQA